MPVPTYDHFIEPILRYLPAHPGGALARDVHEAAADELGLSEADRQVFLPSGAQAIYRNRSGWAHDRLKRAGYSAKRVRRHAHGPGRQRNGRPGGRKTATRSSAASRWTPEPCSSPAFPCSAWAGRTAC